MGRGYVVEDAVEAYLCGLCRAPSQPITGLLVGQSSVQRDFVVMAARTPPREEPAKVAGLEDREWVTEHARQVSRMLPAGLSVLGVFMVTAADAKDSLASLRQLAFAVENTISSERLWTLDADDITDRVTLHVNSQTRKTVCRTFDISDPKSTARPADWRYQSGVASSWTVLSCCVHVDLLLHLPQDKGGVRSLEGTVMEGLSRWVQQVEGGVCLIDGRRPVDAAELPGQRRSAKREHAAKLLISADEGTPGEGAGHGSLSIRGAVHSRAYVHSNKPTAGHACKLLKRDVVSTVTSRVRMVTEELQTAERDVRETELLGLPRRVFCAVKGAGPVSVCDYVFCDESAADVRDRLKEMLDMDTAEEDLDDGAETTWDGVGWDVVSDREREEVAEDGVETPAHGALPAGGAAEPPSRSYTGVAVATAVALVAVATSMLYLEL